MGVAEEIPASMTSAAVVERVVVDQDRAEHGLLGVEIVRKRARQVQRGSAKGIVAEKKERPRSSSKSAPEVSRLSLPPEGGSDVELFSSRRRR